MPIPQGASPYGVLDMAGNVMEWTRSLWGTGKERPDYRYSYRPTDGRENLLMLTDFRIFQATRSRSSSWITG
jgi:formylglycine-generating enzyme required for sulfatase activity